MKQVVIKLSKQVAWAPLAVVIAHTILGNLLGHEPYVDPVMHFTGGVAVAYFFRRAAELSPRYLGTLLMPGLDILAIGLACIAALMWEFGELFSDILLGTHIQQSAPNTLRDLGLGLAGACMFCFAHHFFRKTPPTV